MALDLPLPLNHSFAMLYPSAKTHSLTSKSTGNSQNMTEKLLTGTLSIKRNKTLRYPTSKVMLLVIVQHSCFMLLMMLTFGAKYYVFDLSKFKRTLEWG